MKFYDELVWRGLIKDVSSPKIKDIINNEKVSFYWGTDPTAPSLHLGHFASLIMAKRLAKFGHKPILLVGGATALIGDPKPTSEREIIPHEKVNENLEGIRKQVMRIVGSDAEIVNNYDWMKNYNYLEFLRDIGKYINVNYMLAKDIINRRLETGITYAEFSYTLIQGYDYLNLFREKNCTMQVAGSDQWGNITTGIELIKKIEGKESYGFTMPLVLDKDGRKFGKTEGNALWLDKNLTSSYELYQYLINTDDSVVIDYLKIFTFLSKEEIDTIAKKAKENPEARNAQEVLAREIITEVHDKEEYEKAVRISKALFKGNIKELTDQELEDAFKGFEVLCLKDIPLIDLMVENKVASSKREAREFLSNNAITLNGDVITDENYIIKNSRKYNILRRGKKKYYVFKNQD